MTDVTIQDQVQEINRKLDAVLEHIELQRQKRESFDDLVEDLSIVAKDAFNHSVTILEKAQVEVDSCGISCLIIKILQNIGTFNEMLEMMESAKDFMKDVSPIIRQMGLDAVHKLNDLDQKGYFEYLSALGSFADKWVSTFTAEDLKRVENNLEGISSVLRNLTDPDLLARFGTVTKVLAEVRMDDTKDNVSYWKLFRQMRSPEVRKSLSYSLRILSALNQRTN